MNTDRVCADGWLVVETNSWKDLVQKSQGSALNQSWGRSINASGCTPWPRRGRNSLLSSAYIRNARPHCRRLPAHSADRALFFALASAGRINEARIAMIAMTTSNSINVNAGAE